MSIESDNANIEEKNNGENSHDVSYLSEPCLGNIPIEIFLEICSYLEPSFIIHTLSIVCKRFESILADDMLWRYWVNKRLHNNRYPPITCPSANIKWDEECVLIDRLNTLWKDQETALKHVELKNVHYASVDSILLMKEGSVCVSGGRDRTIAVWNVKEASKEENGRGEGMKPTIKTSAHDGWIWDLACPSTNSDIIFSAAWDSCVKVWTLNEGFQETNSFKCNLSVLCVTCIDENIAVAGLFSPDIVILDKRSSSNPVSKHKIHKGSVLDITYPVAGSPMLYTCSEDKTVAIFDMRKGLLRRRKHLDSSLQTYALSLTTSYDFCPYALYAGDTHGNVHLLDMRTLQKLSTTPVFSMDGCKINGLVLNPGALFACSELGNISIMNPSFPPVQVSTASALSKISGMHYENDVLAVGTCDSSVELWVPLNNTLQHVI